MCIRDRNNGVEDIRGVLDDVNYAASAAKYTVYIIDEVHMLSQSAFNALLKTLEEPPENVMFILATTEAHKVPQTILSRCQRFDFRRISADDIAVRMKEIAYADGYKITDGAFRMLASLADGSMRDGLSIMERVISAAGNEEMCIRDSGLHASTSLTIRRSLPPMSISDATIALPFFESNTSLAGAFLLPMPSSCTCIFGLFEATDGQTSSICAPRIYSSPLGIW